MQTTVSECPVEGAMVLLSGRWRALILYYLSQGPMRFNALRRELAGISQQMLTRTLKALERDGMVSRTVHPTVPPQVEYELTALGHSLSEPILALGSWAQRPLPQIESQRARYDRRHED